MVKYTARTSVHVIAPLVGAARFGQATNTHALAEVEPVVTPVPELTGQLVSVDETVDQL